MESKRPLPLLENLGEKVREARKSLGYTLADLAERAALSRRFLGDLERGRANISLLALARVATALKLPLDDMLHPGPLASPGQREAHERLRRMSEAELEEVLVDLRRFGPHPDRARRLALVGLRGAGKTTIGRRIARDQGLVFVELDETIEARAGLPLSDLFAFHGEAHYRQLERQALEGLEETPGPLLLAVGGSIVTSSTSWQLLRRQFVTCWLEASPEDHWSRVVAQGDHRPMEGQPTAMARLREILAERTPRYQQSRHHIDTTRLGLEGSVQAVAGLLIDPP